MKNYKIILISFVLIFFFIGAVSAAEENSNGTIGDIPFVPVVPDLPVDIDPVDSINLGDSNPETPGGDAEVTTKDIYVNSTGDDSNVGSEQSPYATVDKAVSNVNASNGATIHIAEGTYLIDGLTIDLDHKTLGGNLKIVGAGADKTFLDGKSANCFATIGENSNVTIKDITFINFKNTNGGTIVNSGFLTVDSCIFKDSYATNLRGGAIYSEGYVADMQFIDGQPQFVIASPTTKILNSLFDSTYINSNNANSQGGAIYAVMSNIYLENNTFVNTGLSQKGGSGVALYIMTTPATLINNKFINLTGTQDASIYISNPTNDPMFSVERAVIVGNEFINCSNPSDTSSIVNLNQGDFKFENNIFVNSTNSLGNIYCGYVTMSVLKFVMDYNVYNVSNSEVSKGFKLNQINITDDMDNIVCMNFVDVNLKNDENTIFCNVYISDDERIFIFDEVPENGIYNLTLSSGDISSDVLGVVNISLNNDPFELWVSPKGLDSNKGTFDSPFATIQRAIDTGFEKSFSVVIHLLEGTYTKDGNVELIITNQGSLQILGDKYNETIIDGEGASWFLSVSTTNVNITNLKFINGDASSRDLINGGGTLYLENCIIDSNPFYRSNYYVLTNTKFDKLVYTNNNGVVLVNSQFNITNSYFANNEIKYSQGNGVLRIAVPGVTISDSKFINNTGAQNGGAIDGYFTSINNYYENNTPMGAGGAVYITGASTFVNDTFVNNHASDGGVFYVEFNYRKLSNSPKVSFDNCKFINNSASIGGVGYLNIGKFTGCSFINNTADYGGAFYLVPYIKVDEMGSEEETINSLKLDDCKFENNIAIGNGNDVYLVKPASWRKVDESTLAYGIPLTITFNSQNVSSLVDDLTATVYGPCGAVIGAKYLTFELNGTKIASPEVKNSVVTFNYAAFEDGEYILNGTVEYPNAKTVVNQGLISVKLENIINHVDVWVSAEGSDENGNGSESNPFKSISKAIKEAVKNCRDITIYIAEGTYAGDLNTGLTISSLSNITLVGEGIDKTIIDGENATAFAKITAGDNKVTLKDLTIKNMMPANVEEFMAGNKNLNNLVKKLDALDSPITVDEGATLYLDGVRITSCRGGSAIIRNNGKLNVENSLFNNNGISSYGIIYGGNVSIDDTEISSNVAKTGILYDIHSLVVNNSLIKNNFNLLFFEFTGSSSSYGANLYTVIENTIIFNDGDNSSLSVIGYNGNYSLNPAFCLAGNVLANNISMINSFGSPLSEEYNLLSSTASYLSAFGLIYGTNLGRTVSVSNSTFINLTNLWSVNTNGNVMFSFDGCLFDGITMIAQSQTPGKGSQYNITNSVFIDTDPVIDRFSRGDRENPNCTFENNYWGSNDKPVITYVNPGQGHATSFEPETWIILTEEEGVPVFKTTDGVNTTEYLGALPAEISYVADENGDVIPVLNLAGTGYKFTVDENGSVVLNTTEPMKNIVPKFPVDVSVFGSDVTVIVNDGSKFTAKFTNIWGDPLKDTNVSFRIGEKTINATTDANGTATFDIDFALGQYLVSVINPATGHSIENTIAVITEDTTFAGDVNATYGDGSQFSAMFTDEFGVPLANTKVAFRVGNDTINATTNELGVASFIIDFKPGVYSVTVVNPITGKTVTVTVTVTVGESIVASDVKATYGDGSQFSALFTDEFGSPLANTNVTFKVGTNDINATTDANGTASFAINFNAGSYNVTVTNPVTGQSVEKSIVVSPLATKLSASKLTMVYNTGKYLKATLKDVNGKALANQNVTIKINGKTYNRVTNANGQVSLKITLAVKNAYTATITYKGTTNYAKSSASAKVVVKKATPKLTAKKKVTFKAKTKTKKLTVTLKDNKGKVMKKVKVTIKVGKKTYKAKTNSKGKATFKITKLTKKGKYTAKVKFAGNKNFKAVTKSVKVTVKK